MISHAGLTIAKLRLASKLDPAHLSRDPEVVAAYRSDPLVTRKVSARWFTEASAAFARALAMAPTLTVPTLVMQAGADRLVDPGATRRWVEAAPAARVGRLLPRDPQRAREGGGPRPHR